MKEKTRKFIMAGLLTLGTITAIVLPATVLAEDRPTADLTVGVYSKYVWRGFELSRDSMVIQPSMSVGYKGWGFNLWGNLDTDQTNLDTNKWNETDMTISYDGSSGIVGYGAGLIYYALDSAEDSQELYASLSLDTILSPTLTAYREIANYPGWYVTLGIGHSFTISEKVGLDLDAQVGYLDDDADYSSFHDGLLSAALSIQLNDYISIAPELYWSFALSGEASDVLEAASFDGDDDSFVYGGIAVSFTF